MTENQALYFVFALLYLWECLEIGDSRLFRFRDPGWGQARPDRGLLLDAGRHRGLWFSQPLPPLGRIYRAGAWGPAASGALGVEEARTRHQALTRDARWLSLTGNLLFMYVFILWPGLVLRFELTAFNIPLLFGALILNAASALQFRRLHKKYFPGLTGERRILFLQALLLPTVAIRLRDQLGRGLMSGLHPLAAAKILCGPRRFGDLAGRAWREALHPLSLEESRDWKARLEAWLSAQGQNPGLLGRPPKPQSGEAKAYCPRCGTESVLTGGNCPDCPGVGLLAYRMSP